MLTYVGSRLPITLGATVLALPLAVRSAAAGALVPTRASQTLSAAARHDTVCTPFGNALKMDQIENSDGTESAFAIPPGFVFVVTSAEVTTTAFEGAPTNSDVEVKIFKADTTTPFPFSFMGVRIVTTSAQGSATATFEFPTGIPVKGGLDICTEIDDLSNPNNHVNHFAIAHGFLAKDS